MLEQEQYIFDAALVAQFGDLGLQAQAFVICHATEIEVLNHGLSIVGTACLRRSWKRSLRVVRPNRCVKRRAVLVEHQEPQDGDKRGNRQAAGSHEDVQ